MDLYCSTDVEILLLASCKMIEFGYLLEEELKKNYNVKIHLGNRDFFHIFQFCTISSYAYTMHNLYSLSEMQKNIFPILEPVSRWVVKVLYFFTFYNFDFVFRGNISRLEYCVFKYAQKIFENQNVKIKSNFNSEADDMKVGKIHPDLFLSKDGLTEAWFIHG